MPKVSPNQTNFNGGEFSPLVYGRVDQDWYKTGLALCENYVTLIQGPVTRRPGTMFVAEVKDSSASTRIVRFEYSTTQAYILEFGNQYVRFYKDQGQITQTAQNITAITKANPAVLTYSGADTYANGDRVVITGVLGMSQVNNREFTVANVSVGANTFELSGVNSSAYDTYTSGGTVAEIYEISTPYATADLFQLKFTQSADTLYITHPTYAPRKLTRTSHTSWTLSTITFRDGPYLPTNATATTITLSGTTGSVTATASAALFTLVTDVGRIIRWKDPANNWTWLTITAVASTTSATVTISGPDASAGTATVNWRLGVWSDTTGYPGCTTFFEDRLFFAGATNYPQRLDGSNSGDYENFAPSAVAGTVTDSNAVAFTLNSNTVNTIRWLVDDEKGLLAGSVGGEWIIRPSSASSALTPTNISAKQSTRHGSANVQPVVAGRAALFVQRVARKLRELAYVFEVDGYRAPDLTVRAEHISRGGIKELAYQQELASIVWAVRNDGVLLGMTYDRDQQVLGWHRHIFGGAFSGGDPVVESVACIPEPNGTYNELWAIVKLTVNGGTKRFIVYQTKFFEEDDDIEDAFFVDAGLTYSGSATTTITGLWHLEGQTVAVLADGAAHPDCIVTNGKITLQRSSTKVHVGLGYTSNGQTLRVEAGAADGTAQGKTKRVNRLAIRFFNSVGMKIGPDADNLSPLIFRNSTDDTNTAVPPYTGDLDDSFEGDYDTLGQIYFRQDQPLPSTVECLMPQLTTQDR